MSDRYTKKDAYGCAGYLAKALHRQLGDCWKKTKQGIIPLIKCWELDCNPTYGGCVIEEIMSETGGVTQPFRSRRRKPEEFCNTVNFALDVLEYKRRKKVR